MEYLLQLLQYRKYSLTLHVHLALLGYHVVKRIRKYTYSLGYPLRMLCNIIAATMTVLQVARVNNVFD